MESRQKIKPNQLSKELLDEQSPELLKELHLLTRDGHLNADARRKLKQVNHLYTLLKPALVDLMERHPDLHMVDVGAGKAYLGFILYELVLKNLELGNITSVEARKDLVEKGKAIAQQLGYTRMTFVESAINEYKPQGRIHLVTALHACDTATDDALILGIQNQADHIAVVPCCQAEVAALLKKSKTESNSLNEIWSHGIHRREFGSHLTNVIRALVLEAFGYQVTVTELVGWEHSMKNEFIWGKRIQKENKMALQKLEGLLKEIPVYPKLVRELLPQLLPQLSPKPLSGEQ